MKKLTLISAVLLVAIFSIHVAKNLYQNYGVTHLHCPGYYNLQEGEIMFPLTDNIKKGAQFTLKIKYNGETIETKATFYETEEGYRCLLFNPTDILQKANIKVTEDNLWSFYGKSGDWTI